MEEDSERLMLFAIFALEEAAELATRRLKLDSIVVVNC